jgi:hypothetical protein
MGTQTAGEDWITADEAAKVCGVTRACIHNWRKAGVFKTVQVEKTPLGDKKVYRFVRSEVDAVSKKLIQVVRA